MRVLLLGGTRNLGPDLVAALLAHGHEVTVLHRGQTPFAFPLEVAVLHADRTDPARLGSALAPGNGNPDTWDLTVDTTLYTGPEARAVTDILRNRTGRYIALSTGQVYLVRTGVERPFREEDYPGPLMPEPAANSPDLPDWRYGIGKRDAEDALFAAHRDHGFPAVTLRLPMINSRRDHYGRLRNLIARMLDGQPLLIPDGPHLTLRHVSGDDVIQAILRASAHAGAPGIAWNISQPESISLPDFLALLARLLDRPLRTASIPRHALAAAGLLRAAAPFSDPWMSALDPARSLRELGMQYTPLEVYLADLVAHALADPIAPAGYAQRSQELALLEHAPGSLAAP